MKQARNYFKYGCITAVIVVVLAILGFLIPSIETGLGIGELWAGRLTIVFFTLSSFHYAHYILYRQKRYMYRLKFTYLQRSLNNTIVYEYNISMKDPEVSNHTLKADLNIHEILQEPKTKHLLDNGTIEINSMQFTGIKYKYKS